MTAKSMTVFFLVALATASGVQGVATSLRGPYQKLLAARVAASRQPDEEDKIQAGIKEIAKVYGTTPDKVQRANEAYVPGYRYSEESGTELSNEEIADEIRADTIEKAQNAQLKLMQLKDDVTDTVTQTELYQKVEQKLAEQYGKSSDLFAKVSQKVSEKGSQLVAKATKEAEKNKKKDDTAAAASTSSMLQVSAKEGDQKEEYRYNRDAITAEAVEKAMGDLVPAAAGATTQLLQSTKLENTRSAATNFANQYFGMIGQQAAQVLKPVASRLGFVAKGEDEQPVMEASSMLQVSSDDDSKPKMPQFGNANIDAALEKAGGYLFPAEVKKDRAEAAQDAALFNIKARAAISQEHAKGRMSRRETRLNTVNGVKASAVKLMDNAANGLQTVLTQFSESKGMKHQTPEVKQQMKDMVPAAKKLVQKVGENSLLEQDAEPEAPAAAAVEQPPQEAAVPAQEKRTDFAGKIADFATSIVKPEAWVDRFSSAQDVLESSETQEKLDGARKYYQDKTSDVAKAVVSPSTQESVSQYVKGKTGNMVDQVEKQRSSQRREVAEKEVEVVKATRSEGYAS